MISRPSREIAGASGGDLLRRASGADPPDARERVRGHGQHFPVAGSGDGAVVGEVMVIGRRVPSRGSISQSCASRSQAMLPITVKSGDTERAAPLATSTTISFVPEAVRDPVEGDAFAVGRKRHRAGDVRQQLTRRAVERAVAVVTTFG